MASGLKLYGRYTAVSWRGLMEHRASFIMDSAGALLYAGAKFGALWVLFNRFDNIRGWNLAEVGLLYGLVHMAFALAEAASPGFRTLGDTVRAGDFDRLLLRPRSTTLQLTAAGLQPGIVGPFAQGAVVLVWAVGQLAPVWTLVQGLVLIAALLGSACLFLGLYVAEAALVFWTNHSLEFMNSLTRGGVATAQYPFTAFGKWLRRFFTLVVPLGCTVYYPVALVLGKVQPQPWLYFSPAVGPLFCWLCLRLWRVGLKRYQSAGS
ncbi:MAG: ABC transporter permease [Candidatus Latescibacteria bacterium]|nr:ABC transporter permease [Candidatus Latescibacterota bacterium]